MRKLQYAKPGVLSSSIFSNEKKISKTASGLFAIHLNIYSNSITIIVC